MWMLAGLAWLGGLISMISESLGELLTTMRVGPIVLDPNPEKPPEPTNELEDIPEGTWLKKGEKASEKSTIP